MGSASTTLRIDASSTPLYCPGVYVFTVTATSIPPGDTGTSSPTTLTVTQLGPPLAVTVTTDKSTYRVGDKITISVSVNRPAEGLLTITPPSGAPTTFQYVLAYGPTYSIVKTLTAGPPIGRWQVSFQADDFCSGFSSAVAYFDVTPDTYEVSISLSGVPPQVSVGIQVDGQSQGTMQGSDIKKLSFKVDTTHTITVDQYVTGDPNTRYFSQQNTWTVSSAGSHTFVYETQFMLTVTSNPEGVTELSGGGWYRQGSQAQTSQAQETLQGPAGTRYVFKGWEVDGVPQSGNPITIAMDGPHKVVAKYQAQYELVVDSEGGLGNPQGSGFYDAGSTATFSVTSPVGFLIQQVFVRWEGDFTGDSPQGSLTMDKPKVVHAVWRIDYTQLYIVIAAVAVLIALGLMLMMKRRRGAAESMVTKPPPGGEEPSAPPPESTVAADTVKCESCDADVPANQAYCQNCGAKIT